MRETAIMDFLNNIRDDGSNGPWVPTSERVIGSEVLAEVGGAAGQGGLGPSDGGAGAAHPLSPPGPLPTSGPEPTPVRPAGFGPPLRGGARLDPTVGKPMLTAEDLAALEELAPEPGERPPDAGGRVGLAEPPVTARGHAQNLHREAAVAEDAGPRQKAASQVAVPAAATSAGRSIVKPIPTWPPPGGAGEWSTYTPSGKKLGPVPSRHRPDPRRAARRRILFGVLAVAAVAVVVWYFTIRSRPAHPAHLGPAAISLGWGHAGIPADGSVAGAFSFRSG